VKWLNNFQYRLLRTFLRLGLKSERGQAMTEYALFTVLIVFPLFFVKFGMPGADGARKNTIEWLFWGFNQYVLGILYVISLPIG